MTSHRLLLLAPLLFAACGDEGPCYGLNLGQRLSIELLEVYDENSSFEFDLGRPVPPRCGPGFDFEAGEEVVVRVTEQVRGNFCEDNLVEVETPVPWELGERAEGIPFLFADILTGSSRVVVEGCDGRWAIGLGNRVEPESDDSNPFLKPPGPGLFPPILFERVFQADRPITPECEALLGDIGTTCRDFFVAVAKPL